jgi:hypothetical protein
MDTNTFSAAATNAIASVGDMAHDLIGAYRKRGELFAMSLERRWKAAFKEAAPQLTAETRKNAARAQRAFSTSYAKGLAVSADGAEVVVDTLVGAALAAVQRAAAFQQAKAQ